MIAIVIDIIIELLKNNTNSIETDFRMIIVLLHPFQNSTVSLLIKSEYLDMNKLIEKPKANFL